MLQVTEELHITPHNTSGGTWLEVVLNRPHALNALTQAMCESLYTLFSTADQNPLLHGIVLRGAGEKAFCAGGDIRTIYHNGPTHQTASIKFFEQEYAMNKALFHLKKPCIALWDGITMGGGVGVSLYGSHRIATEKLTFAMPETGIGFFPDVGGSYFLSRLPVSVGLFLGLTGARAGWEDARHLGLATHALPHTKISLCLEHLNLWDGKQSLERYINEWLGVHSAEQFTTQLPYDKIKHYFSVKSIDQLFENLTKSSDPWATEQLHILSQKSPSSLQLTVTALQKGHCLSFDQVLGEDLKMAQKCLATSDFYEGIRAAVIDKDQKPQWNTSP